MVKILLTGSTGRLGKQLSKKFPDSLKPTHQELDITNKESVFNYISQNKPDVVIHAAAWVDIRAIESDNEKGWRINVTGTENIVDAVLAANKNCYFVYPSTACVFYGDRGDYTEEDVPYPKNFYGVTKLVSEFIVKKLPNHLIIRTDFVERSKWKFEGAFTDRYSTSVFADTLAIGFKNVVDKNIRGLIHLTGKKKITHYDLARITTPEVKPIKLSDMTLPLPRDQSLKSVRGWDILEL